MPIFLSILILFICLFSLVAIIYSYSPIRSAARNKIVIDFSFFMMLTGVILWQLIPALLRIFSGWQFEVIDNIHPSEVATVYLIELISLLVFLFGILAVFKKFSISPRYFFSWSAFQKSNLDYFRRILPVHSPNDRLLTFVTFLFVILYCIYSFTEGLHQSVDWLFSSVVVKAAPMFVIYSFVLALALKAKFKCIVLFSLCSVLLLIGFSQGSHGNLFAPFLYFVFTFIFLQRNKLILLIFGLIVIVLFAFFKEMHHVRSTFSSTDQSIQALEKIKLIFSHKGDSTYSGRGFVESVEWRFGEASRMSVGFLRMYERGDAAGFAPLLNSIYLVPRSFYPDKPIPGSIDGSFSGMGMRLIHHEIRAEGWNMSDFFTGVHSYWEHGLWGVILTSFFIGIYSGFVLRNTSNMSLFGLPVLMVLNSTWFSMPKLWSYEVLIQFFNLFLPLLLILWLMTLFFRLFDFIKASFRFRNLSYKLS